VAYWSTKAAISLKRVKIEEKLLWRAYRNSSTLFGAVPSLIPYGLIVSKIGEGLPHQLRVWGIAEKSPSRGAGEHFGIWMHEEPRKLVIGLVAANDVSSPVSRLIWTLKHGPRVHQYKLPMSTSCIIHDLLFLPITTIESRVG